MRILSPRQSSGLLISLPVPAAHLRAGVAARQAIDLVARVELVHEVDAAALVHPRVLHAVVEAERHRGCRRRTSGPCPSSNKRRCGRPRRCRWSPRRRAEARARSRSARTRARGNGRPTFRQALWRTSRQRRRSCRATSGSSRPCATRSSAWFARWRARRSPAPAAPAAAAVEEFAAVHLLLHGRLSPVFRPGAVISRRDAAPTTIAVAHACPGAAPRPKSLPCAPAKSTAR